ncbi:hypothetical protein G3I67_08705 [Orrella sp. NBD-18]|uniref:Uncharacterized protein n=1 Tax=Sheuella amnicola TaxID=2707330 RepID=A0A6B2QZ45_9BURK|nr:hypothetical protein [Sheuella amnicola]NDY83311.1 hypothetical protein [Sheuella amnicola]HBI83773.1 hypothetical protein [Alcaligenaceae bacterium]
MKELIQRIFRAIFLALLAMLGLIMAFVFTISTVIAILILSIVSAIRGKPFAAKEYWSNRQERNKSLLNKGPLSRGGNADITDVEVRDIPGDSRKTR